MKRPWAEEILGEWGVRDVTPPFQIERKLLEEDQEINTLTGKPLRRRLRNFRPEADIYVASLGGPLPYMQRLKTIELMEAEQTERLAATREETGGGEAWIERVKRWRFDEINDLIEKHNRWYPIEARLPMDPKSRDFVTIGGRSYLRPQLDAAWVLARFPA